MRGDQNTVLIIMFEDREKDKDEEMFEGGKRKRGDADVGGSHQTMNT